ncbi:hypothetical protein GCM10009554_38820 [Kribbella koreensis]|uniref:Fido domain-containing protein n=1 Tax=Kribbella koreensis TaxID=57909 RepID=A0ABN1QLT1_9ACTN
MGLQLDERQHHQLGHAIADRVDHIGGNNHRQCLDVIVRAAAVETGAVELLYETTPGATMSVALDEDGWQERFGNDDSPALGHIEAQLSVYGDIGNVPDRFTEVWFRELHRQVTQGQETFTVHTPIGAQERVLPRGQYKETANEVRTRSGRRYLYAPVIDTQPEMARLVDALNSDEFHQGSAILQATYAHWAIAHIHPFADGNGRVARAVASMFLLAGDGVPFLVFADRKFPYFQALEAMDRGDLQRGLMYFENRCFDAMAWLIELLDANESPKGEDLASELRALLEQSNTPIESRDDAAHRVLRAIASALKSAGTQTEEFAGSVIVRDGHDRFVPERGYRYIEGDKISAEIKLLRGQQLTNSFSHIDFAIVTNVGVAMRREAQVEVHLSMATDSRHAVVVRSNAPVANIYLRLEDISPNLSASADIRIDTFASRVFAWTLAKLVEEARSLLLEHGRARLEIEPPVAASGDTEA